MTVLFFLVIGTAVLAANEVAASPLPVSGCDLRDRIEILAPVIRRSLKKKKPYFNVDRTGGPFRNSVDWHSSVHAHWALLSMARVSGNRKDAERVLGRLDDSVLAREGVFLRENPRFEMPYGRAWFLLLLSEIGKHPGRATPAVTALKSEFTQQMVDWLLAVNLPDGDQQRCRTDGESWLFSYLLLLESRPELEFAKGLDTLRKKLSGVNCRSAALDHPDFVSPGALLEYLGERRIPDSVPPPQLGIHRSFDENTFHNIGAEVSESWPVALRASRESGACANLTAFYDEHLYYVIRWKKNYVLLSHWIPQFTWFGIWVAMGRP